MLRIQGMDHIVLNVEDVERSVAFYHGILGLAVERLEEWRSGKTGFPSMRVSEATIIDLVGIAAGLEPAHPVKNLNHFCLVVEDEALEPIMNHLIKRGVHPHVGPARRWGARGSGTSIYLRDPDCNEIELRTYAPEALERVDNGARVAAR